MARCARDINTLLATKSTPQAYIALETLFLVVSPLGDSATRMSYMTYAGNVTPYLFELAQASALVPGSRLLDALRSAFSLEETLHIAADYE